MRGVGYTSAWITASLVLAIPVAAEAAVKRYCCYRVDVDASMDIHATWDNAGEPGGANGTYDLISNWDVRELVQYSRSQFGTGADSRLSWIENRRGRAVKASWARFFGREQSNQSRNDSNGMPVAYQPCLFVHEVGWRRTPDPGVLPSIDISDEKGRASYITTFEQTGAYGPFWVNRPGGGCNNNVPFYGPDGGVMIETPYVTSWDAFGFDRLHPRHTVPYFQAAKLKRLKDYEVSFSHPVLLPYSGETDDPRFDHTGAAPVSITISFTHFHRDRLQQEINRGNDLTQG